MKTQNILLLGAGVVIGLLLAPKKGSESYDELKDKVNELYLQAKELKMNDVKDKIEDIKIEVSKLDYNKSKEIVTQRSEAIKEKLNKVISDLQENKDIQPAVAGAIDKTEKAINDIIDYLDENDVVDKTKHKTKEIYDKTVDYAEEVKEKTNEFVKKAKKNKDSEV